MNKNLSEIGDAERQAEHDIGVQIQAILNEAYDKGVCINGIYISIDEHGLLGDQLKKPIVYDVQVKSSNRDYK